MTLSPTITNNRRSKTQKASTPRAFKPKTSNLANATAKAKALAEASAAAHALRLLHPHDAHTAPITAPKSRSSTPSVSPTGPPTNPKVAPTHRNVPQADTPDKNINTILLGMNAPPDVADDASPPTPSGDVNPAVSDASDVTPPSDTSSSLQDVPSINSDDMSESSDLLLNVKSPTSKRISNKPHATSRGHLNNKLTSPPPKRTNKSSLEANVVSPPDVDPKSISQDSPNPNPFQTLPLTDAGDLIDPTDAMIESDEDSPAKEVPPKPLKKTSKPPSKSPPPSILRSKTHAPPVTDTFAHRKLVEFSFKIDGEDRMASAHEKIGILVENLKYVDSTAVIFPVKDDSTLPPIRSKAALPNNFTKLSDHIKLTNGYWVFAQSNNNKRPPQVYACMSLGMNVEIGEALEKASFEFSRHGGMNLRIKSLQAFKSETPFLIMFVFNRLHQPTLKHELTIVLENAKAHLIEEGLLDADRADIAIPDFCFRSNNPRLPRDTGKTKPGKYDSFANQGKKVLHVECSEADTAFMCQLLSHVKEQGTLKKLWGKFAHLTHPLDNDAPPGDIHRLRRMSQAHTSFHCSVSSSTLYGITDLNAEAYLSEGDHADDDGVNQGSSGSTAMFVSIRDMLYKMQLPDGSPLFLTVIQRLNSKDVDVVVPNNAAAETRLAQMNKHTPGFLSHYWQDQGHPKAFISALLRRGCDPELVHSINSTTWDSKKLIITTPKDKEDDEALNLLEKQSWLISMPELEAEKDNEMAAKRFTDPDLAFPLNDELSVNTIHGKNVSTASAAKKKPDHAADGTPILYLGRSKVKETPIQQAELLDSSDDDDDMSALTHMTHEQLLAHVQGSRKKYRRCSTGKGSPPKRSQPHAPAKTTQDPEVYSIQDSEDSGDASVASRA